MGLQWLCHDELTLDMASNSSLKKMRISPFATLAWRGRRGELVERRADLKAALRDERLTTLYMLSQAKYLTLESASLKQASTGGTIAPR